MSNVNNQTRAQTPPQGMTCKFNTDGSNNPKYVDLLDEDKPLAGQKFTCISFISPEKIINNKDTFFFKHFLKQWDMAKSLEKYQQFLGFISYKYSLSSDDLNKDFKEFCEAEKDNLFITNLEDDYKTFIDKNEENLQAKYDNENNFQTSVRGVKIRGSFPTLKEAELRCKMLREVDPSHDVYVGPVGTWMPFHPEAYKTQRVEYLEDELNQLMHEKKKNEEKAKLEFDKRVKESKEKAMKENEDKALETGNVLTQTIDEAGQLVSVKENSSTVEKRLEMLGNTVAAADIRRELFEGDNIVTSKETDHGLTDILKNHDISSDSQAADSSVANDNDNDNDNEDDDVVNVSLNVEDSVNNDKTK